MATSKTQRRGFLAGVLAVPATAVLPARAKGQTDHIKDAADRLASGMARAHGGGGSSASITMPALY